MIILAFFFLTRCMLFIKVMGRLFILTVLLIFAHFSCAHKTDIEPTVKNDSLYVIDLDRAEERDTYQLSFFFKDVRCIVLKDSGNARVRGIDKLVAYNGLLYVMDKPSLEETTVEQAGLRSAKITDLYMPAYTSKTLMVFGHDGKIVRRIGGVPGMYSNFKDFTIDTDKNEIILLDADKIHIFDLNGNYLNTVQFRQDGTNSTTLQYHNGLVYTNMRAHQQMEDDCLLQSVNMVTGQRENRFLKTKEHNKGWNELMVHNMNFFIPKLGQPYLFRHSFMDTVFAITGKGLSPHAVIKSKDMITENDLAVPANTDLVEFFTDGLKRKGKIYSIFSYFETPEYIHFRYFKGSEDYFQGSERYVFYNKKSRTTHIAKDFQNDLVYNGEQKLPARFDFFDQKGAYEYFNNNRQIVLLSGRRLMKPPFQDQLRKLNSKSNPVIFYYEFKP